MAKLLPIDFKPNFPALPRIQADDQDASERAVITPEEIHTARGYVDAGRAASTRNAYAADWRHF